MPIRKTEEYEITLAHEKNQKQEALKLLGELREFEGAMRTKKPEREMLATLQTRVYMQKLMEIQKENTPAENVEGIFDDSTIDMLIEGGDAPEGTDNLYWTATQAAIKITLKNNIHTKEEISSDLKGFVGGFEEYYQNQANFSV